MQTETLDKLYLEWSQITKARTGREIELTRVLERIIVEPHGCPMCDSGKLRNAAKEHWDSCGYAMAAKVLGGSIREMIAPARGPDEYHATGFDADGRAEG